MREITPKEARNAIWQALRGVKVLPVENPIVSIIFVARNEDEWLRKSLDSLYTVKCDVPYEVIVVNDASDDNGCEMLACHNYIENEKSVGPSRARNQGAMASRGRYLIFCDSHLIFQDYWVEKLIETLGYGFDAVNPAIADISHPEASNSCGWYYNRNEFNFQWTMSRVAHPFPVPGLAGGCFLIKKDVFLKVGMFDHGFEKWGHEDAELFFRFRMLGYACGVIPEVQIRHFFKEHNEYGIDWYSHNYNWLRMMYVSCDDPEEIQKVREKIGGNPDEANRMWTQVQLEARTRKRIVDERRVMTYQQFLNKFYPFNIQDHIKDFVMDDDKTAKRSVSNPVDGNYSIVTNDGKTYQVRLQNGNWENLNPVKTVPEYIDSSNIKYVVPA